MTVFLAITIPILTIIGYFVIGFRLRHWVAPRAIAWKYDHPTYFQSAFEDRRRNNAIDEARSWITATIWFWPITIPIVWYRTHADPVDWEQYAPWAVQEREAEQQAELERRQQRIRQLERELGIAEPFCHKRLPDRESVTIIRSLGCPHSDEEIAQDDQ